MIAKILTLALELCFALVATASVIKRYQDYPLPVCPINAVCSEIVGLQSREMTSSYLNYVSCKCPSGLYCPSEPGSQTLNVDGNKWYGLCTPVEELPRCQRGEVAQEIRVNAQEFGGRSYTRVQCTCPNLQGRVMGGGKAAALLAGTTSDSGEAKTIYHLMCNEDYMSKRGGRFGGEGYRNRDRFYFYK